MQLFLCSRPLHRKRCNGPVLYPRRKAAVWTAIQRVAPTSVGSKMASAVHFVLLVSRQMVRQVVAELAAHGNADEMYRTQEGYTVLSQEDALGKWEYDLQVRLQRMPKYESVYQNQLLLQLVQMGTLPAGAAFELMDLSNKEAIVKAIRGNEGGEENGTAGKKERDA